MSTILFNSAGRIRLFLKAGKFSANQVYSLRSEVEVVKGAFTQDSVPTVDSLNQLTDGLISSGSCGSARNSKRQSSEKKSSLRFLRIHYSSLVNHKLRRVDVKKLVTKSKRHSSTEFLCLACGGSKYGLGRIGDLRGIVDVLVEDIELGYTVESSNPKHGHVNHTAGLVGLWGMGSELSDQRPSFYRMLNKLVSMRTKGAKIIGPLGKSIKFEFENVVGDCSSGKRGENKHVGEEYRENRGLSLKLQRLHWSNLVFSDLCSEFLFKSEVGEKFALGQYN